MNFVLAKDQKKRSQQLKVFDDMIINDIYRVLSHFGTRLETGLGSCACPIHRGKNPMGFSITIDPEHPYYGRWKCWSESYGETCMEEFINSPIGLIRALLTRDKREDGELDNDSIVHFQEVIDFCIRFFELNSENISEEAKNINFEEAPSTLEFGLKQD